MKTIELSLSARIRELNNLGVLEELKRLHEQGILDSPEVSGLFSPVNKLFLGKNIIVGIRNQWKLYILKQRSN